MKIAYIVSNWKMPVVGPSGPAVHIQEVCRALSELGHEVRILAADTGDSLRGASVPLLVIKPPWNRLTRPVELLATRLSGSSDTRLSRSSGRTDVSRSPAIYLSDLVRQLGDSLWHTWFYRRARQFVRSERPDALYERFERASNVGIRLANDFSLPLVLEMNSSLTFLEQWRHRHGPRYRRRAMRAERSACLRASRILMVSPALRSYLQDLGIPAEKLELVPCGAEPARYEGLEEPAADVRRRLRLTGKMVVGFVGSFKRWIDFDLLLGSARELSRTRPDIHFLLVGGGERFHEIETRVDDEGLAASVTLTGEVAFDEVPVYIAAMDIATAPYPNLPSFNFLPLKLFEYMAAAKPVVVTRSPAIEEAVTQGDSGMLVEPGDLAGFTAALLELADDASLRERLGGSARCTVERRYTWRRQAELIEDLLEVARAERSG